MTASNSRDQTVLLDRIERSWDDLRATLDDLDDGQLSAAGPEGWSVKDHLAHVARWEGYLLAVLEGGDGRAALEVETDGKVETDDINARLQRSDAGRTAAEVRGWVAETHARVVARLQSLDDADLERRRAVIAGNTHEHYAEHAGWIRTLTAATTS